MSRNGREMDDPGLVGVVGMNKLFDFVFCTSSKFFDLQVVANPIHANMADNELSCSRGVSSFC